jgi:hypothetical protein
MRSIAIIALAMFLTAPAAADDLGLWRLQDDEYVAYIPGWEVTTPFTLFITLHDASVTAVGGYEVGITLPDLLIILQATGPSGWTNFGDPTNHLVGYTTPLPTFGEPVVVLGQLECLGLDQIVTHEYIAFGPSNPQSIPDHDGPVIADGVDPDHLIACGYVGGMPEVFGIFGPDAVEARHWTGVKTLFR